MGSTVYYLSVARPDEEGGDRRDFHTSWFALSYRPSSLGSVRVLCGATLVLAPRYTIFGLACGLISVALRWWKGGSMTGVLAPGSPLLAPGSWLLAPGRMVYVSCVISICFIASAVYIHLT